ncbi:hypothetical protein yc1106_05584 [Curvularia clavata]|uniref:Heterokaryon incompatibility domain-containing protein n=1 Tax=Curvularia clavata TaxID=95742 RepID=A0A9Q9DTS8_CURCL|nr:hypothetical protein yc1106_05584 [Curvularia clavata]
MADIYENACITIAAVSAADSTQGLFSSDRIARRLLKHPQFYAKARMPTLTSSYGKLYFDKPLWPLLSRAWVYQERCLSPRVVYFGNDQIYWQCRYMFTSEDNRGLRIWERESGCDWRDWTKDPVGSWREIIREYSVLQLTYEKDRLPAIAAVASRMSLLREPSDVYLAGMWKNSLISDLCWCCDSSPQPRPERRVPSWSWASTQRSQIHFYEQSQHFNVNVVSLTYNIVGRAYLGAVENCKLVLRGYVLPLTETRGLSHENISDIHREIQDQSSFMFAALRVSMQSHGFVLERPRFYPDYDLETAIPPFEYGASLKLMFLAKRTCFIGGVVLRQLSKDADEYERIGFISSTVMSNSNKRKIEIDRILQSVPIEDVQIV